MVYGQLIAEKAALDSLDPDLLDGIFDVMVRDFSRYALQILSKPSATQKQAELCRRMIRRPSVNFERFQRIWERYVYPLRDAYQMSP